MTAMIAPARLEEIRRFLAAHGYADAALHPLAGDASFRRYVRLRRGGESFMLMDAPPEKEDVRPFAAIARHLHGKGYSAPVILAEDASRGFLLLEDFGDDSFTSVLKTAPALERELYAAAIDVLAGWHQAERDFSGRGEFVLPAYDHALLMREIRLFSDWYLPLALGAEKAATLGGEYEALWEAVLQAAPLTVHDWVHRDYHADNLMWLPSRAGLQRVGLLDFQDGVYGDAAYDLVSLLEDARRDVPEEIVAAMLERYIEVSGAGRERFMLAYAVLGAQRNSKIVGIFARLAVRDGKQHYLHYLPRVWRHLERNLSHPALAGLKAWLDKHVPAEQRGVMSVQQAVGA